MARRRGGANEPSRAEADASAAPGAAALDQDPGWVDRVRTKLTAWYHDAQRDLPWRANRDPYRILVSETMLVQTTVAAVVPFYERFVARFPRVEDLAAADESEVLKAWEGLGYYRRARQLHAAARAIVATHGGVIPDEAEALAALPGVGRYIAGALLSIAFDRPAPILEANTQRVLARWLAWEEDLQSAATRQRLWEAAARLVPPTGAGAFNQAFMELGALICTPRSPGCLVCPVARECRARELGIQDRLPVRTAKASPLESREAIVLVRRDDDRYLLLERGPRGLWHGFWEFPTIHLAGADPAGRIGPQGGAVDLAAGVKNLTGVAARVGPVVRTLRYVVTRHRVEVDVHEAEPVGRPREPVAAAGFQRAAWVPRAELRERTFSAAGRRLVAGLAGPV